VHRQRNHLSGCSPFWACQALGAVGVTRWYAWWTPTEAAHAIDLIEPAIIVADDVRIDRIGSSPVPLLRMQADVRYAPSTTCCRMADNEDDVR
jgi:hypothetical protein